jgi:DNA-binding NarL/FixJ family response regulator
MSRPSILLADDHAIVAEGLQSLLEETFEFVGRVSDGRALVEAAKRLAPAVIVADISMPLLNGLDAVRLLHKEGIRSKVVFLTMHSDSNLVAEAFRAGASGYVLKQSAGEELVEAIQQALAGRTYITPFVTNDFISLLVASEKRSARPHVELTTRQREVLQLIAEGKTMKEISSMLNISTRTAESHKYEMMGALGVQTTAELIRHAVKINLVTCHSRWCWRERLGRQNAAYWTPLFS